MEKEVIMIKGLMENFRFHKVRGRRFSEAEMDLYKIRGIYNMVGVVETMTSERIRDFCKGLVYRGSNELAVIEKSLVILKGNAGELPKEPLMACSVIIFSQRELFVMFALADGLRERYFHEGEYDEPVLHIMN